MAKKKKAIDMKALYYFFIEAKIPLKCQSFLRNLEFFFSWKSDTSSDFQLLYLHAAGYNALM